MRVAIIGAGPSGIAVAKVLKNCRNVDFTIFEKSDSIGGIWSYRNSLGKTAAYQSLHIDTS